MVRECDLSFSKNGGLDCAASEGPPHTAQLPDPVLPLSLRAKEDNSSDIEDPEFQLTSSPEERNDKQAKKKGAATAFLELTPHTRKRLA